jgi:hypothetical protein
MAINYIVHYSCNPKKALGSGDIAKGTERILALLKARDRAAVLRDMAIRDGRSPEGMLAAVRSENVDGTSVETSVTYDELLAQASALDPHASQCSNCRANFLSSPFGCFGVLNYPVRRRSEKWLMSRLQPIATIGGQLLMAAVKELHYTGEPIENMRAAGLFESPHPKKKVFKFGLFSRSPVTSNHLFEAILGVGECLDPCHCMGILLWLGAIRFGGIIPKSPAQAEAVNNLATFAQRTKHTTLELGPPTNNPAILAMHSLLRALYTSWTQNVPLLIS